MVQTGIYGGSFNPIHTGHIQLAEYILQATSLEEVWFIVSPNNPLKSEKELIGQATRFQWVKTALQGHKGLIASDFEFTLPTPSYTINTLQALQRTYPEHRFSLIIGADNLAIFRKWKDWETILKDYALIVYPRKGEETEQLQRESPAVTFLPDAPLHPISSTEIRQGIRQGKDMQEWIPQSIYSEVKKAYRD